MKKHIHQWRQVSKKPWLKTFGSEIVLECKICHTFVNASEEEASKLESKTRLARL